MQALKTRYRRLGRVYAAMLAVAVLVLPACQLDSLLNVDLPGVVSDDALADAQLVPTMAQSVIADLECAWDNYVAAAAIHSDEYMQSSSTLALRNWGTRRILETDADLAQGTCQGLGFGLYTPLHTARFQAEDVFRRISEFPSEAVANKETLLATVRAYGAFALTALGEGFCEMALDVGPLMQPADVLSLAESRFSEAITLATQAGNQDILRMALTGRARVRLNRENFAGALADAELVPSGYLKNATRDGTTPRRYNTMCEIMNCPDLRHATVTPPYRAVTWQDVPDPRVRVSTTNVAGHNNVTVHYFHNKASSRAAPVSLAGYKETRLYIAEAAARSGDLTTARTIINALHAAVGIPGYDPAGTATQDEVIRQVLEERRRELFAEGGHRLNDHLRFRGTAFEIPMLGEAGSIHPNGQDPTGLPYGSTVCFPLPTVERVGNPNL